MRQRASRVWRGRLLVPVLLPLWAAFAASWVIISTRYSLHLSLFPVPMAGSMSMNLLALILYLPPIILLLTMLGVPRRVGALGRVLVAFGWLLAALLAVALALAIPAII